MKIYHVKLNLKEKIDAYNICNDFNDKIQITPISKTIDVSVPIIDIKLTLPTLLKLMQMFAIIGVSEYFKFEHEEKVFILKAYIGIKNF